MRRSCLAEMCTPSKAVYVARYVDVAVDLGEVDESGVFHAVRLGRHDRPEDTFGDVDVLVEVRSDSCRPRSSGAGAAMVWASWRVSNSEIRISRRASKFFDREERPATRRARRPRSRRLGPSP